MQERKWGKIKLYSTVLKGIHSVQLDEITSITCHHHQRRRRHVAKPDVATLPDIVE
jgi:hypothetical protein